MKGPAEEIAVMMSADLQALTDDGLLARLRPLPRNGT
jgi:hypothetical protein